MIIFNWNSLHIWFESIDILFHCYLNFNEDYFRMPCPLFAENIRLIWITSWEYTFFQNYEALITILSGNPLWNKIICQLEFACRIISFINNSKPIQIGNMKRKITNVSTNHFIMHPPPSFYLYILFLSY